MLKQRVSETVAMWAHFFSNVKVKNKRRKYIYYDMIRVAAKFDKLKKYWPWTWILDIFLTWLLPPSIPLIPNYCTHHSSVSKITHINTITKKLIPHLCSLNTFCFWFLFLFLFFFLDFSSTPFEYSLRLIARLFI